MLVVFASLFVAFKDERTFGDFYSNIFADTTPQELANRKFYFGKI